jgi:hypothetical protein
MILIAHRGNINGPDIKTENTEEQISKCIQLGYHVEIDIRYIDGELYLGHDIPTNKTSLEFLLQYKNSLWIHCKNLDAILFLKKQDLIIFSHDKDNYVLCSNGIIWAYPGQEVKDHCISVMPEWKGQLWYENIDKDCYGICSDYVEKIKLYLYSFSIRI